MQISSGSGFKSEINVRHFKTHKIQKIATYFMKMPAWGKLVRSGGSEIDPSVLVPSELVFGSYESFESGGKEREDIFFGRINPSASDLATRGFTHSNQVVISVPYASATHFKITRNITGEFVLTDLSRNGTIVNGEVVSNNHPVALAAGDRVGLKFKNDTKVEYTFHVLLALSNAAGKKATPNSANRVHATGMAATSQQSQCDQVLLEQLQRSENTCRKMTEEHAALTAQIGMLESQLADVTAGRAVEKSAAAAERESAAAERNRMLDDHRVQMLDANSTIAANAARCADLESKLEIAQRATAEQGARAKAAAAQVVKLQEQLQDQATTLQGTRESYVDGQARNTAAKARLHASEESVTRLEYANAALQHTLDAREREWANNAAAVTQSLQTHESKLRGALHAVLNLGPPLSSILQQLEQAGEVGVCSLEQLAAGVASSIGNSNGSSSGGGEATLKVNSQQRAWPADTHTQASEMFAAEENNENMDIVGAGSGKLDSKTSNLGLKSQPVDDVGDAAVGDKRVRDSQQHYKNTHSHSQSQSQSDDRRPSRQEVDVASSQSPGRLRSQPKEHSSPSASDSSQTSSKRVRSQR